MKRTRRTGLFVLAIVALISIYSNNVSAYELHGLISISIDQKYLGLRPSRLVYDAQTVTTNISFQLPCGFYGNVWDSYGLDSTDNGNGGDEVDLTLGWNKEIFNSITLDISVTLFNEYPVGEWVTNDTWVQSLKIAKGFKFGNHSVRPEFWVEWLSKTDDVGNGALVLLPNVNYSWIKPLDIKALTFFQTAMLVWDSGFKPAGNDADGLFLRWMPGLNWKLSKDILLTLPGFTALIKIADGKDGRETETSWNMGLSIAF